MSEAVNRIEAFSTAFKKLVAEVETITLFDSINEWDMKAKALLEEISSELNLIESAVAEAKKKESELSDKNAQQPFYKKLFVKNNESQSVTSHLVKLVGWRGHLDELADKLQSLIDMTPNSQEEQKILIKELKLQKRELQAEKKEVAAEMREIRVDSRQKSAQISNYGFRNLSRYAAAQRRTMRLRRELDLAPRENAKAIIDKQILQIERHIIWVEKLR